MGETNEAVAERVVTDCGMCRRCVLVGECLVPFHDPRADHVVHVCELCRSRARLRGWEPAGEPERRRGDASRLRVEPLPTHPAVELPKPAPAPARTLEREQLGDASAAPQRAILDRLAAPATTPIEPTTPPDALLERIRSQDREIARLRRESNPAQRAHEQQMLRAQTAELRSLRDAVRDRDARIERLQQARHAEASPMRMAGFALDAFNQSAELDRMARIARTLGAPVVNVHDEGPGVPRRTRLTLSWDIAWYEFVVKLDLGAGKASVHPTGSGGDSTALPLERRRANAQWRDSGIVLA